MKRAASTLDQTLPLGVQTAAFTPGPRSVRGVAWALLIVSLSACITGGTSQQEASAPKPESFSYEKLVWSAWGPDNQFLVRTVTDGRVCPPVTVDGQIQAMTSRGEPSPAFPVRVCEAAIDEARGDVRLGAVQITRSPLEPKKIVVLGDTGCRLKSTAEGVQIQACNDPNKWPFALIAKAAAAENPDLVVHVGDYHYREAPCPEGNALCRGSAYGDVWGAWYQDFFAPAGPLLAKAPWIFLRGNHELCARAGQGWFRLLDPRPLPEPCVDQTPPYTVTFGKQVLAILDAADAKNIQPSLASLPPASGGHLWILAHRPFLSPPPSGRDPEAPIALPPSLRGLGKISMVLAGHRHVMSLNQFRDNRPLEVIAGNSGTELDRHPDTSDALASQGGPGFQGTGFLDFGYLTMERISPTSWAVLEHDRQGKPVIRCEMQEGVGLKTVLTCDTHAYEGL